MLRRVSVYSRIACLAAIGFIAVAIVGAAAWHARTSWLETEASVARLDRHGRAVLDLSLRIANAKSEFAAFSLTPMEHLAEQAKASLQQIAQEAASLGDQVDGQLAHQLAIIRDRMREAQARIESAKQIQLALGSTRNAGLLGEVIAAATALEGALRSEFDRAGASQGTRGTVALQAMLRHQERLLVTRDTATEAELLFERERLERALVSPQLASETAERLRQTLALHARALDAWLEAARRFEREVDAIDNAFTLSREPLRAIANLSEGQVRQLRLETLGRTTADEKRALSLALVALAACAILAVFIIRSIAGPLDRLRTSLEAIARGDTGLGLADQQASDEIGQMTRAAAVFRDQVLSHLAMSQQAVREAAERGERARTMERSVQVFDTGVSEVLSILGQAGANLGQSARQLDMASREVSNRTREAQDATGSMTQRISAVAAATDELSLSIAEIASGTHRAAEAADDAIQQVDQTDRRMRELLTISAQIGDVVTLIRAIASQTNLLALNATIEAARAGEAGRGFAIVASEVKTLAAQTQLATEEIGRKIEAIQAGATNMSESIQDMSRVVLDMRAIAVDVASAIKQQDQTVAEIAQTMAMLSGDASQNLRSVEATAQAAIAADAVAREVGETAQGMSDAATRLSSNVETFVETIRAA